MDDKESAYGKTKDLIKEFLAECNNPLLDIPPLICPELTNNYEAKLALLLMLANTTDVPYSKTRRDRIHILLLGYQGTGKSVLLDYLNEDWAACYISCAPTGASLKGDARKDDFGVKIFNEYDGGIVAIDDIELMKEVDTLRDVMERGRYTITKGGRHREYDAHCRITAASNDITRISEPILGRFDIVVPFEEPTIDESMSIVNRFLTDSTDALNIRAFLRAYVSVICIHEPKITDTGLIKECFEIHFTKEGRGKSGRWIGSVWRIAKAFARIQLKDITSVEIGKAIEIKKSTEKTLNKSR